MHRGRGDSNMASRQPGGDNGDHDWDFQVLMDHAHGFMVSQVLFAACDLGVFDAAARGPVGADEVSRASGSNPRATQLLMDTCAELGLLRRAGPDGSSFANTPLSSAFLVVGSPLSQRSMLLYLAGTPYRLWGHLTDAVREGRNQYERAVGVSAEDPFAAIYRSEAERLLFMRGLQETWSMWGRRVLTAFDLSPFRVICDVGGGSGALAREAAHLYPSSTVIVFDTPEVVGSQVLLRPPGEEEKLEEGPRVRFLAGDFFCSALPPADLYVLARVLHDWGDAACEELLRRVHRAGGAGSSVLLVESVMAEGGTGPLRPLLLSLNMLLQTCGRERSEAEYRNMAARAGLPRLSLRRTGGPYDAMLAQE